MIQLFRNYVKAENEKTYDRYMMFHREKMKHRKIHYTLPNLPFSIGLACVWATALFILFTATTLLPTRVDGP